MDERERRRAYRQNAVLIDSDRVLTPQFDDAIVYLTGAQLELLRNVSQYLNRRETYRAEKHPGYYLMPDDEDYDDILAIVADMEESLMGNPNTIWGFKEQFAELIVETSTGEAYTDAEMTPVPAGSVFSLERWQTLQLDDTTRYVTLNVMGGGVTMLLDSAPNQAQGIFVFASEPVTLVEGDYLRMRVTSLADTKDMRLYLWGTMMDVP